MELPEEEDHGEDSWMQWRRKIGWGEQRWSAVVTSKWSRRKKKEEWLEIYYLVSLLLRVLKCYIFINSCKTTKTNDLFRECIEDQTSFQACGPSSQISTSCIISLSIFDGQRRNYYNYNYCSSSSYRKTVSCKFILKELKGFTGK